MMGAALRLVRSGRHPLCGIRLRAAGVKQEVHEISAIEHAACPPRPGFDDSCRMDKDFTISTRFRHNRAELIT